jgi:hypothetical protein
MGAEILKMAASALTTPPWAMAADGWTDTFSSSAKPKQKVQGEYSFGAVNRVFSTHETWTEFYTISGHSPTNSGCSQQAIDLGEASTTKVSAANSLSKRSHSPSPMPSFTLNFQKSGALATIQAGRSGLLGNSCLIPIFLPHMVRIFEWLHRVNSSTAGAAAMALAGNITLRAILSLREYR